eukprot:250962_1
MCKVNIIYDDSNQIIEEFKTKQGKQMLINTNLFLRYIAQRKLDEFTNDVLVNMEIKYQHMFDDGAKSNLRIWRCSSNLKLKIGKDFNWKLSQNTTFSCSTIYVSSLWVTTGNTTANVNITNGSDIGECQIICKKNILIDEQCSISMNARGVKGAVYGISRQTSHKCNGRNGKYHGGGGGYKYKGANGGNMVDPDGPKQYINLTDNYIAKARRYSDEVSNIDVELCKRRKLATITDGHGGDKYLTNEVMKHNDYKRFSVGFGGV